MTSSALEQSLPFDQSQFWVAVDPDQRLLRISGELDIETVPILQLAVTALVKQPGDLTIDLAELAFIDSAGLNEFVQIGVSQDKARHRLTLVGTSPAMCQTFVRGGLTRLIT
jgi:anti-anti-sigma factor